MSSTCKRCCAASAPARGRHERSVADRAGDRWKVDLPFQEESGGDFIGGIEDCTGVAARGECLLGQCDRWKALGIDCFEGEFAKFYRVEGFEVEGAAFRVRQAVEDWHSHVGDAHLRHDRTVDELDHRVDDTLGVDHHLDLLSGDAEEPPCFQDLEGLVHHGRGTDGDARPHLPGRVPECFVGCDLREGPGVAFAEGSAGSGEPDPSDLGRVLALQALVDCAVLGIDRQDRCVRGGRKFHEVGAGHDQ